MVETACLLVEDFLDQVLRHFDFDYATRLGGHLLQERADRLGATSSANVVMPRYKRISTKLHAARHRPVVHRLRRRRAPDPARTCWKAASTACSPSRSTAAPTRRSCSNEYGKDLRIMGGVDKIELGKGREAIKALPGDAGAAGGARRLHPLLRPPLPAQREARGLPVLPGPEGADVRDGVDGIQALRRLGTGAHW